MHHRGADLLLRRLKGPVFQAGIGKLPEPMAHPAAGQQVGQVVRRLLHPGEQRGQGNLVDFVMRKEAALARQAVIGKLHGKTNARARVGPPGCNRNGIK